ncbi:hypothetical protein KI387_000176, partial [Taxus chinensis]
MEDETPLRNVKPKLQATDSAKNAPVSANLTDFSGKESFNIKRNRGAFVVTAPTGNISTNTAKNRLSFGSSLSVPRETSESSSFNPRKLGDQNKRSFQENSKETAVNFTEPNLNPSKLEGENSHSQISKQTSLHLPRLELNPRRLEAEISDQFQEVSKETPLHLPRKSLKHGRPEDRNSGSCHEISKETAPHLSKLNLNPRKFEDHNLHSFQEIVFPQNGNSVPNLKKRPQEALKPSKITSRKLDRKDSIGYREPSEFFKNAARKEAGTPNVKQNVESEGEILFTDKLHGRSPSFFFSRPSLSGIKNTPTSKLHRPAKLSLPANRHRAEAASRLKAMENEQIQVSRLAQERKDLWMDRQEKAYSAWLNFVLKQPMKPNASKFSMTKNPTGIAPASTPIGNRGKRYSFFKAAGGSENEGSWRTPRRNMFKFLRGVPNDGSKSSDKSRARLLQPTSEACLQDVCLLSDLRQRLEIYLDSSLLEDVISTMVKVAKYVEDGRLKMKEECAIITDVGLKERAVQVLMNYNPTWLRIGLYVVLGHNVLVTKEKPSFPLHQIFLAEGNAEADSEFLKLVIEKHFFGHAGLSKNYASNKSIDGLYRPGYHEALGKVILKRFFLFVLALDKIKCHSTLPIENGIDGLDGGSPLLFCQNTSVKSSRQALQNFLLDVMHGEGDLLGHLATIGYQVFHVQVPLADYDFHVTNLIENLQDGVRLCRLVQLLLGDASVLMRIIVPSDHHKKHMHNCKVSFQYLLEAGVPLIDEEGYDLVAEDLVMGNRERILSLLWNIFVHLQMPLLITKKQLCEEIIKIKGPQFSNLEMSSNDVSTTIDLMLIWIQEICGTYDQLVEDFQSSFADGKSFLYLIDFYLPGYMPCSRLLKEPRDIDTLDEMMMNSSDTKASIHKYSLVQDAIKHLYNIPEVLQMTDFLEGDPSCNERNVIILLTFLSSQLLEGKPMNKDWACTLKSSQGFDNYEKIIPDMHSRKMEHTTEDHMAAIRIQAFYRSVLQRRCYIKMKENKIDINKKLDFMVSEERAAIQIQFWWRALIERMQFIRIRMAASLIQHSVRAWLKQQRKKEEAATAIQSKYRCFVQRRQFLKMKAAVSHLQCVVRAWIVTRCIEENNRVLRQERASIVIQSHYRGLIERRKFSKSKVAALLVQRAVRVWIAAAHKEKNIQKAQISAVIIIQSHIRGWLQRSMYNLLVTRIRKIQSIYRVYKHRRSQIKAAVKIQCSWKRVLVQSKFSRLRNAAIKIQSFWRGWLARKYLDENKAAATVIQSWFRGYRCWKQYKLCIEALINIQCVIRGRVMLQTYMKYKNAACKLQRAFRAWLARKYAQKHGFETVGEECKLNGFAIVIQAAFRGWQERKKYNMKLRMARRSQVKKTQSAKMSNKGLEYPERDCAPKDAHSLTKFTEINIITEAAKTIQRFYRGHAARLLYSEREQYKFKAYNVNFSQELTCAQIGTDDLLHDEECTLNGFAVVIQTAFRGWQERKIYKMKLRLARRIQAIFRGAQVRQMVSKKMSNKGLKYPEIDCASEDSQLLTKFTEINITTEDAKTIQRFYRGYAARLLSFKRRQYKFKAHNVNFPQEMTCAQTGTVNLLHDVYFSNYLNAGTDEVLRVRDSVVKLQRWWRNVSAHRSSSATVIQSHFRGWLSRKIFLRLKSCVLLIQACWRSHFVRKNQVDLRQQLSNLRFRMGNSAANVDDNLRLENRLTKALEALLNHRTLSGIIHTCATLDTATQHSKRCCERLVAAGAIEKLLQLINETNRSAPHEEVLKHALSVLCNIAHYPELAQLLVNTPDSITQIAKQLWRNKEEGFSKAIEILKKLCAVKCGADIVQKLAPNISRLQLLAQKMEKKVEMERRSLARLPQKGAGATRKAGEKRLREAESQHHSIIHLLQCITGESGQRRSE